MKNIIITVLMKAPEDKTVTVPTAGRRTITSVLRPTVTSVVRPIIV